MDRESDQRNTYGSRRENRPEAGACCVAVPRVRDFQLFDVIPNAQALANKEQPGEDSKPRSGLGLA